jgi:polar amino acid transport system substrate-binding protein
MMRNELAGKVKSAKDLDKPEYTVVTKLGVTGEIATKKFFKKAKILTFETEADAAAEVLNGRADAVVYDQPYNVLFMSNKGKGRLIHLDIPLTYEPLAWAIRKGDPDFLNWLNNFLRQMQEDKVVGFSEGIYKKWLQDTAWLKRVQ